MQRSGKAIETRGIYELFEEIASGGMATVRLARWIGHKGFSRVVAVKQLYPQFARDGEFVAMFLDEARLSARVRHPNVVPILDIVSSEGDLFLVMDYVHGESIARLHKLARLRGETIPPTIACTILAAVMHGLHAAHEARTESGEPLQIIHRDVTPQNVLVGVDGCPRILDFGVAQAAGRLQTTRDGQLKGKLCYMAPEQLLGGTLDWRVDIYSASAMLWEMLAGRKLFTGNSEGEVVRMVLDKPVPPPSSFNPHVPLALDEIVLRGLQREADQRFTTAREMALAIERETETVPDSEVGAWVERVWGDAHKVRGRHLVEIESSEKSTPSPELAGGALPAISSNGPSGHPVHAPPGDPSNPDRSMINTRRIVGLRSLLTSSEIPAVPAGDAVAGDAVAGDAVAAAAVATAAVAAVVVPSPETRVETARTSGRRWVLATIAVAAVVVLVAGRATVLRSRGLHSASGAGAGRGAALRELTATAAPGESTATVAPTEPTAPVAVPQSAGVVAPHEPPAAVVAVAGPRVPVDKSGDKKEAAGRIKNRTRHRTLMAQGVPGAAARPRAEHERLSPPRAEPVARSECDPPFIVDAAGIKRMKVSCL